MTHAEPDFAPTPHPALLALVGRKLESVEWFEYASFIFRFGDALLQADSLWRIVIDGRLRVTSAEHGHQYGLPAPIDSAAVARDLLVGRCVTSVEPGVSHRDLLVRFGPARTLQLLPEHTGYEAWQFLCGPVRLICFGNGVEEI